MRRVCFYVNHAQGSSDIQRALVKLMSALRGELNLPRDDDEFMEQLKDMERRAWAAVNKAYRINPPTPMPEITEPA